MQRDDVLFWSYDWQSVVDAQRKALREKVYALTAEEVAGRTADQVADALAEEFALVPPEIDPKGMQVARRVAGVDVSRDPKRFFTAGRPGVVAGEAYDVTLPFTGDPQMFAVRPLRYDNAPPAGRVGDGVLEFTISGLDLTPEAVAAEMQARCRAIADYLRRQAESLGTYAQDLRRMAGELAARRTTELAEDDDLWAGLDFIKKPPKSAMH
jgi:hypothetical protein